MGGCTLGQVLHGSATTTEAIRRAIQRSQESLRTLAKRHGINPKTVAKWRRRSFAADLPTGPKQPSSTVLSIEEEAIVVAVPSSHAVAARRLPLCAAADDPAPKPIITASLSTSLRFERQRASSTCSSRLTEPRNSPSSHCTTRPIVRPPCASSKH